MSDSRLENPLYFWNKSHVVVLEETAEGFPSVHSKVKYSGRTPSSIIEYLAQSNLAEYGTKERIISRSYSVHDYYSTSFPILGVSPDPTLGGFSGLLHKLDEEQIIVVDLDSADQITCYAYDSTSGMRTFEIQVEEESVFFEDFSSIVSSIDWAKVAKSLSISSDLKTSWIITGEVVHFSEGNWYKLVGGLVHESKGNMPFFNHFYIDQHQLFHYLVNFPHLSLVSFLVDTEITLVNLDLLPDAKQVQLISEGEESKNILVSRYSNLLELKGQFSMYGYPGLRVTTKYFTITSRISDVGDWQSDVPPATFSSKPTVDLSMRDLKLSPWLLPLPSKLAKRMKAGKFKKSDFVFDLSPTRWFYTPNVSKSDLLVTDTQLVEYGEQLNKKKSASFLYETKECFSPATGRVDLSKFDSDLIGIRQQSKMSLDYSWIGNIDFGAISSGRSGLRIELPSIALPLSGGIGNSMGGSLIYSDSLEDAISIEDVQPSMVLVVGESISYQQLRGLFDKGFMNVVTPNLPEINRIPDSYWKIFNHAYTGHYGSVLADVYLGCLISREAEPVFVDIQALEIKLLPTNLSQLGSKHSKTLNMESYYRSVRKNSTNRLVKGDKVYSFLASSPFAEGEVLTIDYENNRAVVKLSGTTEVKTFPLLSLSKI